MNDQHEIFGSMHVMRARLDYAIRHTYPETIRWAKEHDMRISPEEVFRNVLMNIVAEQMKDAFCRGAKSKVAS
jgi:hypothetical protein